MAEWFLVFISLYFALLKTNPKTLSMLSKCSTTEPSFNLFSIKAIYISDINFTPYVLITNFTFLDLLC
jgi:hypothetical protein